jgi:hypothetical protein
MSEFLLRTASFDQTCSTIVRSEWAIAGTFVLAAPLRP